MALTPSVCASEVLAAYREASNLLDDMTPDSDDNGAIQPPSTNTFAADFAEAYNSYATEGVVLGVTNTGGDASTIQSMLESFASDTGIDIDEFAQAFADYWGGVAVTAGLPAHGGVAVESVSNNCASKGGDIAAAIRSQITDTDTVPYYENLINAIQTVIQTAEWTVTEKMSDGSSVDFTESVT